MPHKTTAPPGFSAPGRSGHTLVELVISVAASGLLLAGIASAVFVASQASKSCTTPSDTVTACMAAKQLTSELRCAVAFSERTPASVEFTVADRNGDLSPETIRYAWSGVPGDAITRQYNGGAPVEVVADVRQFDLTYPVETVTETTNGQTTVDSGEVLLAYFDGWAGLTPDSQPKLSDSSEYFVADFPAEATRLSITRVSLKLNQIVGGSGSKSVAIHYPASAGNPEPGATPIGTPDSKLNSELPSNPLWLVWTDFFFSDVVIDNPGNEYCIVVTGSDVFAGELLFYFSRKAPVDATVGLWTTDGGTTWEPDAGKWNQNDIPFYVYGSYTTTTTGETELYRYFVTRVTVALRTGPDASNRVDAGVRILNAPEVTAP